MWISRKKYNILTDNIKWLDEASKKGRILSMPEYVEYLGYKKKCEEEAEEWDDNVSNWETPIDNVYEELDDMWDENETILDRLDDIEAEFITFKKDQQLLNRVMVELINGENSKSKNK